MTGVDDTMSLLPQLLAENAQLKTKVGIPERERVLQDVLQEQLQRFFDDARRTLENAVVQAFATGNGEDESATGDGSQRVLALVETLRALGAQNEELLRQMGEVQTKRVADLNRTVEQLECERDTLRYRVQRLEEEAAATARAASDDQAPPSLLAELRSLRASDALFRQQLEAVQQQGGAAAAAADGLVRDGIHASLKVPRLLEQLEGVRASLHEAETERELLRLQLQESQQRGGVQHALREAQLKEEVAVSQSTVQQLLARVVALEASQAETQATASAHLKTIDQLESTIQSLHAKHAMTDEALASKRQRLEEEILDDPNSVRREYIMFWREGREELQQLREEVQQLRTKERLLRTTQEKLTRMERTRSTVTSKLATLCDEIDRVRKENQSLRAQSAGLEVERDFLRSNLAAAISRHMQEEELQCCCAAIRDAAAKSAAASSSVVADPQAIQQAMQQSQELKNEVAQLTKQKEKLHRYIALREERVNALITHQALHSPSTNDGDGDNGGFHSVLQTMTLAELHAEDTLFGLEEAASSGTNGGVRRRGMLLSMHQRITEKEQQLELCQKQLKEVIAERDDVQKQLATTQAEMRGTLAARESSMSELLKSNTTLTQLVNTLRSEKEGLRECYDASVTFAHKLSSALTGLLGLLRAEVDLVAFLNDVLAAERAEVMELTRRSAVAWDVREGEVQQVLGAVDRMCDYILQSVEQQQRSHTLDDTVHLRRLAEEVKLQEERLKEMQQTFAQACRELGEDLAKRISEAQQRGDVIWKKRVETLMEERQQLQAQLVAEKDLLTKIERSMLVSPSSSSSVLATTTATAPAAVLGGTIDNSHQVLDAVNQLLTARLSRQGAVNVNKDEEKDRDRLEEEEDYKEAMGGSPLFTTVPMDDDANETMSAREGEEEEAVR